jgi:hypothetical protein
MQVIWKDATGFEPDANGKAYAAEFKGIESKMDKDCAIFRFVDNPDDRAGDQAYFLPLHKLDSGDVKTTIEFLMDPDALFKEWLEDHGTKKQLRVALNVDVKKEGREKSSTRGKGGGGGGTA